MTNERLEKACEIKEAIYNIDLALKRIVNNDEIILEFSKIGVVPFKLSLTGENFNSLRDSISQELRLLQGRLINEFEKL